MSSGGVGTPKTALRESEKEEIGHRRGRWLLAVFLAVMIISGFYIGATYELTGGEKAKDLYVHPTDLDFGEVWVQEGFQWTLPINNRTARDIEITEIQTSCECTGVEPTSCVVPANGSASVQLKLDLKPASLETALMPTRDFSVQLIPKTNDSLPPIGPWEVRGRVRSSLVADPQVVNFGETLLRGEKFPAKEVAIQLQPSVKIAKVDFDPRIASVTRTPNREEQRELLLQIRPKEALPDGDFHFKVELHPEHEGSPLPAMVIDVRGGILPDILAVPRRLSLGPVYRAVPIRETIVIQSRSGVEFRIGSVTATTDEISVERARQNETYAVSHRVRVDGRFERLGDHAEEINITIQLKSGESKVLAIPVSLYVVAKSPDVLDSAAKKKVRLGT